MTTEQLEAILIKNGVQLSDFVNSASHILVIAAMHEALEKGSVEFAEWVSKNGHEFKESNAGWYWYNGPSAIRHTTQQLYTQFKNRE